MGTITASYRESGGDASLHNPAGENVFNEKMLKT